MYTTVLDNIPFKIVNSEESSNGFQENIKNCFVSFLACHYDTLMPVEGFVGAIDAAVPCAQILDLARALTPYIYRKNKTRINCDISSLQWNF